MRKGQGAVEYIIILGVIILIALIVVSSLGGLGIFQFSSSAQARTTEISNLLSDVAFTYRLDESGAAQVSVKQITVLGLFLIKSSIKTSVSAKGLDHNNKDSVNSII